MSIVISKIILVRGHNTLAFHCCRSPLHPSVGTGGLTCKVQAHRVNIHMHSYYCTNCAFPLLRFSIYIYILYILEKRSHFTLFHFVCEELKFENLKKDTPLSVVDFFSNDDHHVKVKPETTIHHDP